MMVPWVRVCSSGDVEKRLDFICILTMELMGFVSGWDVGCEGKRLI